MALPNAAQDVASYLDTKTAGGVTLTRGTNLFAGPMRSEEQTPSPSVFLLNTGGPAPRPYLGGTRIGYWRFTVQVLIRGEPTRHRESERFARDVFALLWLPEVAIAAGGFYVSVTPSDSGPAFLGPDESRRGQWGINLECGFKGAAG